MKKANPATSNLTKATLESLRLEIEKGWNATVSKKSVKQIVEERKRGVQK